jgi:hypothetical protein
MQNMSMDNLPLNYHPWSDRLAMDIALALEGSGESIAELMRRHNITQTELIAYNKDSMFLKKVDHLREEVKEKGMTFRLKAKAQAEELLTTSWTLIHSADVSAAVKADLIKSTVKWGNLEPQKDATSEGMGGGGVTIQINLPAAPQALPVVKTIENI